MQTLLGMILFSMLLAPGSSLQCDTCRALGESCTGTLKRCGYGEDACASVWIQITTEGAALDAIMKGCIPKSACSDLKSGLAHVQQYAKADTVKKVECSKAPAPSGSLFLALSGLLFLKMLS